ncbi:UPF0489 protein C5orf22 [Elysia marginata]|uniref:UPF0489 protein C5orf22 n=1 Tax=Elysia marginata TaxID=1093978 RepID=A0AAV4F8K1_9GAST|nr:UPF0489 protein C5orf22 [Elysia marginata]
MRISHRIHVTFRMARCALVVVTLFICLLLGLNYFTSTSRSVNRRDNIIGLEQGYLGQGRPKVSTMSKSHDYEKALKWGSWGGRPGGSLPVYIVEEHHEAARYWMWAAQAGVLGRRSGNTLIHFDAHSDLAPSIIQPGSPLLNWPKFPDVSRLVNENDRFIQAVALTGLFSRVVWVWPTWDRSSILREIHSDPTVWNITLGTWLRPIAPIEMSSYHKTRTRDQNTIPNVHVKAQDICICATSLNPPKHWNKTMRGKICLRVNSSDPDELPVVSREGCLENLSLKLETYSETEMLKQIKPGGLFHQLSTHQGFVLDIDEDFFGCAPVVQSLYDVGLKESHLREISFLVEKLFCGDTAEHERLSDMIFYKITQYLIENRTICGRMKNNLSPNKVLNDKCVLSVHQHITTSLQKMLKSLSAPFVERVFCGLRNDVFHKSMLYHLLRLLAPLDNSQLQAIAEVGICFQVSLHSYGGEGVGHFRLCDGYNRPNDTMVTFFSPKMKVVKARGKRLQSILGQLGVNPDLVTLCRSIRDGYTPRPHFRQIEKLLLNTLEERYSRRSGATIRVMYDRDLLGGKKGWWHRHHENRK